MKIGIMCTFAAAALAMAGCGKAENGAPKASEAPKTAAVPAAPAGDKNDVMVSVNGKKLTRGEIDADVETFIASRNGQIPPEQIEQARKVIGEQMAQQFLMKTILLGAAEQKGIKVTDEDRKRFEAEFVKAYANRPNAPKSLKEAAAKHPLGAERGLKELEESFTIQKMLEQEVTSKIKVDPKQVDEKLKSIAADNANAAKKALDAEAKIKSLAKQLEGLKGDALAKKFVELAKANSECPSKEKGGDLGEFTRGRMVKEFEDVAFKQEINTVSAPVKTQFGWHLIMPTKKIPATEAKGDKPAEPEKVQASHILVMSPKTQPVPTKEDVEKGLKRGEEQNAIRTFIEGLRKSAKIEAPGYPSLLPPAPKPAAKTTVESKPVEVKSAAKPAAKPADKPAAKPAAKPADKPAEAKK